MEIKNLVEVEMKNLSEEEILDAEKVAENIGSCGLGCGGTKDMY